MQKLALAMLFLSSTTLVHADYKFIGADETPLTELCIAATTSTDVMYTTAESLGLSTKDLDSVRCNNTPIKRFALKYSSASPAPLAISGYLLKKSDSSAFTELCAAAAISDTEYVKVKKLLFRNEPMLESELKCNGRPLKTFVRKFREVGAAQISLR